MRFVAIILSVVLVGCATDRIRPWSPAEVSDIRAMVPTPVRLTPFPSFELSKPILGPVPDIRPRIQDALKEKAGIIVRRAGADGTIPPPSTLTCDVIYNSTGFALSAVSSGINSANDGDVICLERGSVWTASSGLNITTSHPDSNRVTICASTGTTCSDSGAANPRIVVTGNDDGVHFVSPAGGYTVTGVDLYNTASVSQSAAGVLVVNGTHDIRTDGMVIDGFFRGLRGGSGCPATFPTNIDFGMPGGAGHWVEIRNYSGVIPSGDRHSLYGNIANSAVRTYVHSFRASGGSSATSHYHDLGDGGCTALQGAHDVVFEDGQYDYDLNFANKPSAVLVKINRGYGYIIRNNVFQVLNGNSSITWISISDHASVTEGVTGSGVDGAGASIYGNTFIGGTPFKNVIGQDIDFYNNIWVGAIGGSGLTDAGGFVQHIYQCCGSQASSYLQIDNSRIFNNSMYVAGDTYIDPVNGETGWRQLMSNRNGVVSSGRQLCTNCDLFNNAVYLTDTVGAKVFGANQCSEYGTNGVNIQKNFVYTPGDSTPAITSCSAATWLPGSPWNTNPKFVDAASGDFNLQDATSPLYKTGTAGCPATDKDGNAQTSPCTIGAYSNIP